MSNEECVVSHIKGKEVKFYPKPHTYYVDGIRCMSATQIATYLNPFRKMKIPTRILNKAGLKGTVVHDAIEHYLNTGEDVVLELCKQYKVDPKNAVPYFEAFLQLMIDYKDRLEILHVEKKGIYLHEMKDETVIIVGTIDIIAKLDGETIVLDWKTSSAMTLPEWRMQLSIYKKLIEYSFDIDCKKRYIGWLRKTGEYQMIEIAPISDDWVKMIFNMLHSKIIPIIEKFNLLLYEIYGGDMIK